MRYSLTLHVGYDYVDNEGDTWRCVYSHKDMPEECACVCLETIDNVELVSWFKRGGECVEDFDLRLVKQLGRWDRDD